MSTLQTSCPLASIFTRVVHLSVIFRFGFGLRPISESHLRIPINETQTISKNCSRKLLQIKPVVRSPVQLTYLLYMYGELTGTEGRVMQRIIVANHTSRQPTILT